MAKILNSESSPNMVIRRREESGFKKNRADQELDIGLNAKKYLDSFFTTLNDAPSFIGTYYSTHVGETTFSENTNVQKNVSKSTKFIKINKFVMWGQKNTDEIEKKGDEDRETIIQTTDQECVILQGTIKPLLGDHFVFDSQGRQQTPMMVTEVRPMKLIDKPVYAITLSPSTTFTMSTIEQSVVGTYMFVFGNIGTQRKTLLRKNTFDRLKIVNSTLIRLNKMYVDMFYDVTYDAIRYNSMQNSKTWLICKALREFQAEEAILTWGEDMNTLFSSYPFVTIKDTADYRRSYLSRIIRRKLDPFVPGPYPPEPYEIVDGLRMELALRDKINEDNYLDLDDDYVDIIENYVPKYMYRFKLYTNIKREFSILTQYRASGLALYELNSIPSSTIGNLNESFYYYDCGSKIFQYILDLWMEKSYAEILETNILDDYLVNSSMDDYLMLPIIMYVLSQSAEMMEQDDLIVTF